MMKILFSGKILVLLLAFSLSGTSLSGQTYSNKVSSILSFTAGLTSTNLINDSVSYRSGILFNGGLGYSVMLTDKLNVAIEILYTGKGFKNDSPIIKYRHYFADIPLYAQIRLGENMRINAGFQYSIATNSQMVTIDPSKANGVKVTTINVIKPMDYGLLGGAELDLSKNITLGARYTISASAFQKNEISFGVFLLSFKYSPIKTHQVFFRKKEAQQ
jgi:hypothetical protein